MIVSENMSDNFDEKFELYGNMLYRLCMVYLKNTADSEDAVQNAFIKLIYNAPTFKTQFDEQRWLVRVTINICKNHLSKAHVKRDLSLESAENVSYMQEVSAFDIVEILDKLPDKYKSVIYLHYTEGFTTEEISKILSMGQSAVKMRLKRGREILKDYL